MAGSLKIIRRRIRSAKNIGQITKAMEMVAASKMRRAQKEAQEAEPYSEKIYEVTYSLLSKNKQVAHPLLKTPENDNHPLFIIITSNRGLCGSLNINLFRSLSYFIENNYYKDYDFITLGKKGLGFVLRFNNKVLADFSDVIPFTEAADPIIKAAREEFVSGRITSVWLAYSRFINALKQEPIAKRLLPIVQPVKEKQLASYSADYLIEPSPQSVINILLPFYLESQVREAILQHEASEQSARMLAMKNATDNSEELTSGLTLEYNKARQQAITMEISDIITAKVSMEKQNE